MSSLTWRCLDEILELCQDPNFQDVTIICQNGKFSVNSFLLAAVFPVFRNLFDKSEDEEIKILMKETRIEQLQQFFKSIFEQDPTIQFPTSLVSLLSASEISLKKEFINDATKNPDENVQISILKPKNECEDGYLDSNEYDYVDNNFDTIEKDEDVKNDPNVDQIPSTPMKYSCEHCDYSTNYSTHFKKHVDRVHMSDDKEKCQSCKEIIKKSQISIHECSFRYHCTKCDYKTNLTTSYKAHMASLNHATVIESDGKIKIKVSKPNKVLKSNPIVKKGVWNKKEKLVQTCTICGYKTSIKQCFTKHLTTHIPEDHEKCYTCKKVVETSKMSEHKCISIACDICDKSFYSEKGLITHKATIHDKRFVCTCDLCGKQFTKKDNLKIHIQQYHTNQKFQCSICDLEFKTEKNLKSHAQVHSAKTMCTICGISVRKIENHMSISHNIGEAKYHCDQCGKGFMAKRAMKQHEMNVHLKLRPYVCRYEGCEFRYNDTSNRGFHEKQKHGKLFGKE